MAVLDLETGRVVKDSPDISQNLQPQQAASTQPTGGIIDLNTGAFVDQAPIQQPVQQQAQPGLTEIAPRSIQEAPQEEIEGPGFFETAGDFLSNITLDSVSDLFTGESKETDISRSLPEIGSIGTGSIGADIKIASGLLASANEEDQIDIIRSAVPNAKFFRDEKQNVIVELPDGNRAILNQPGLSFQDSVQTAANILSFIPSARLASLGKTLTQKAVTGVITAGATQTGLQSTARGLGAERDLDIGEITTAAALGGGAELVVPAVQAVRGVRQAKRIGIEKEQIEEAVKSIRPAREAIEGIEAATGRRVGLFPAQQTEIPSELLKQRLLPQLDAGSRKAAAALERQNKEVFEATSELLNTIAPAEAVETGAKRFRTAAQNALQASKDRRSLATRDLYKNALNEGAEVNLKPVRSLIDDSLDGAPEGGEIVKAMSRVRDFIKPKIINEVEVQPTLKQLQKAKFEVDNMLEKFGENSLGNTTKRDVLEVKKALVRKMEDASPLYKQANEKFAELSPSVTNLENSIIGSVSKVDDVNLQNISRRIFSPGSNPAVVKNAKAIIDKVDPGAWDDMLRTEVQRRFGGIETLAEDLPGELIGNVPGQLRRAIFGNPEQRRTLLSAMTSDQRKNFIYLDEILRRASSGRQAGSPTAAFGEALNRLKGVAGVIRDTIFRPVQTLQNTGERGLLDRNVKALTEVMFNPNFKPKLTELKKLNPNSPAAARAFLQLLNTASKPEEE